MLNRRQFLRGTAAAAVAPTVANRAAAKEEYPHRDAQPESVTLSYDEDRLLTYAPRLIFKREAREKFQYLAGWTASSPNYGLDWHCFVALYTHQEGLGPDTHFGDTEWFYVASDPDSGDTQRVVYDAYHWLAGKLSTGSITLDGQAPVARVVSPWHPYALTGVDANEATTVDEIKDLTKRFDGMLANGLAEDLEPGTVTNPERMDLGGRTHWWRSTIGEFSFDAMYASVLYRAGFAGADSVDSDALAI